MALPSARLAAATRTLSTLSPADIHLWRSVAANGDGGAGLVLFVRETLQVSEACSAGRGVSELRAEAMACLAGLQATLATDQCLTVAQLRTGHSPLLAAYLHRTRRRDSSTCRHCNGAEETRRRSTRPGSEGDMA